MTDTEKPREMKRTGEFSLSTFASSLLLCTLGVILLGVVVAYAWSLTDKVIVVDLSSLASYGRSRILLRGFIKLFLQLGYFVQILLLLGYPYIAAMLSAIVASKAFSKKGLTLICGLWFGLVAEYALWVVWLYAMTGALMFSPNEIISGATFVSGHIERPWLKGFIVSNTALILWTVIAILEFVFILALTYAGNKHDNNESKDKKKRPQ